MTEQEIVFSVLVKEAMRRELMEKRAISLGLAEKAISLGSSRSLHAQEALKARRAEMSGKYHVDTSGLYARQHNANRERPASDFGPARQQTPDERTDSLRMLRNVIDKRRAAASQMPG